MAMAGGTGAFAQAHPETTVSLLSAPFGTATYVLFNTLEQISKKHHPWLRISSSESPGFVFNMKKLDAEPELRKTTIVGSGPAVGRLATDGVRPFDKKLPALKVLGNCHDRRRLARDDRREDQERGRYVGQARLDSARRPRSTGASCRAPSSSMAGAC